MKISLLGLGISTDRQTKLISCFFPKARVLILLKACTTSNGNDHIYAGSGYSWNDYIQYPVMSLIYNERTGEVLSNYASK